MADVFHIGQHDDLTAHDIYKTIRCYYNMIRFAKPAVDYSN